MGFGAGLNKHQDFPSFCLNKRKHSNYNLH